MSTSISFTAASRYAWDSALELAALRGSAAAEPMHLVMALLSLTGRREGGFAHSANEQEERSITVEIAELSRLLAACGVDVARTNRALTGQVERRDPCPGLARPSAELQSIAANAPGERIRLVQLLAACCAQPPEHPISQQLERALFPRLRVREAADLSTASADTTPLLDELGRDLSALARAGQLAPFSDRRREHTLLSRTLLRTHRAAAVLVGEPGVGRTAIFHRLAQRFAELAPGQHPRLAALRLVQLRPSRLSATSQGRAEAARRLAALLLELRGHPEVVLVLDDLVEPARDELGLLSSLAPLIEAGDLKLLASATPAVWAAFKRSPQLAGLFEPITVEEPSVAEALPMVERFADILEQHSDFAGQVRIEREAVDTAVRLSHRYLSEGLLPGKACRLLENACHASMMVSLSRPAAAGPGGYRIGRREVASVVAEAIDQPLDLLLEDDTKRLLMLQPALEERILGQEPAIGLVCSALRRAMAMRSAHRPVNEPVASFLFVGPTGVGKSQLGKSLAPLLFGSPDALHHLDLTSFKEKHDVYRIVGPPPGYVGHGDEPALCAAVRRRPFSVVLLDEIDKAHPEVLDALMPVLDDGCLVDSQGQSVDFTNTVIILTSNLGAQALAEEPSRRRVVPFGESSQGRGTDHAVEAMIQQVREQLRPEFISRLTELVVFRPLEPASLERIARLQLAELLENLPTELRQTRVSDEVCARVVREGCRQGLGVRELHRALVREIFQPLNDRYLAGEFEGWEEIRVVERGGGGVSFEGG